MVDLLDNSAIITLVRAALDNAGLDEVGVTDDATQVGPLSGLGVVYVNPPTLEFENFDDEIDTTWKLDVIQGTAMNLDLAKTFIGKAIHALHSAGINIATATPATWHTAQAVAIPAYTLTLNPF